jgi:hypothetical protein
MLIASNDVDCGTAGINNVVERHDNGVVLGGRQTLSIDVHIC